MDSVFMLILHFSLGSHLKLCQGSVTRETKKCKREEFDCPMSKKTRRYKNTLRADKSIHQSSQGDKQRSKPDIKKSFRTERAGEKGKKHDKKAHTQKAIQNNQ